VKVTNKISRQLIQKRLLITLLLILVIRVGSFLPVPGINHVELALYIQANPVTRSLVSTFSGNNTFVIGLFTLNIFPFINASIFLQLLIAFSPTLAKLQKEGDLNSRRNLNRLTRLVTIIWAIIQSLGIGLYLKQVIFNWSILLLAKIVIWLTTGSMIVLFLSELITEYGLGNGASLLIYTNIISNLPNLYKIVIKDNIENQNFNYLNLGITLGLFGFLLFGTILLQDGVRPIALLSSKQLNQIESSELSENNNYLPLRLNQAGVMPIILTTTILVLPNYLSTVGILPTFTSSIISKIFYWIGYFSLIFVFSSFYSTIVLNPKDISDQLQKMAVTIPGVRPGVQTAFYLKKVMQRLTLVGALMLAILATFPNFIEIILNTSSLSGLSTTSLLIMTGVLIDISKEIDDIIYSNIYKKTY
jgi:preprotein translocase subunit SecY